MRFVNLKAILNLAVIATLIFAVHVPSTSAKNRPFGDVEVLATFPTPPGFPEGIAVKGNRVYVAGPARFGTSGTGASAVFAFDIKSGDLVQSYFTQGEDLAQEHANSCIAFDGDGRLYVLNTQLGVLRIDTKTGAQEIYAQPLPDLKPCVGGENQPCSPTPFDAPPLSNDIVFDEKGNAFITDSLQATIWRVRPAGGAPEVWFQDIRLASASVGVNGIRLNPARNKVFITVTEDLFGGSYVYTLPLVNNPTANDLKVFHQFAIGDLPDGIAFGKSGNLYVAMATPFNSGIAILRPDGTEGARLANAQLGAIFPYDSPANIAFNHKGSLLVTNHAFVTMIPSQFTVLDVFVNDKESPLAKPNLP